MLSASEVESLCAASEPKLRQLEVSLRSYGSALVAFSGGVDSAFVLKVASQQLPGRVVALTAVSPSVAPEELDEAKQLAEGMGVRHVAVDSHELDNPRYAANPSNRCYFCKTELYGITEKHRLELKLAVVLDGFNADDKKDHRPGHQAAREHEVKSPLAEAGLTKNEIRAWSHKLGLSTWDKPQLACLASRLPYGTEVTAERLGKVGAAERAVRKLGFKNFRVRYHDDLARLEVAADELPRLDEPKVRAELNQAIKSAGFTFVAVDLEPFRSGRLNDALSQKPGGYALPVLAG